MGGFRPRELLAEGKAASVYLGDGPEGVAVVKTFRTPLSADSLALASRLVEIDHPQLTRFLAVGEDWVAMEFLDGPNLEEILSGPRLSRERVLTLAARIAAGVGALHAAGWVHRDLKPSNVIVLEGSHPKIVDFGLARPVGAAPAEASFEGSWGYAAPEQIQGRAADPRADIYSLGVILYRMLLGRLPFGDAPVAAALGHLHDRPPPPREQDPTIPPALEDAILRALAKEPEARFPTMESFAAALEACELPQPPPAPTRRPWIPVVGGAIALALIVAQLAC